VALSVGGAITHALESHTKLGQVVSGPLIAIVIGLLGSGVAGCMPVASPAYDTVSTVLLPMGVALYVLEVNVARVFSKESSQMLLAFVCGALGTCLGTVAAYALLRPRLSIDGMHLATALCASYIGGSVNFAAVITALGTRYAA
jgi:uncharacterized membrane protein